MYIVNRSPVSALLSFGKRLISVNDLSFFPITATRHVPAVLSCTELQNPSEPHKGLSIHLPHSILVCYIVHFAS